MHQWTHDSLNLLGLMPTIDRCKLRDDVTP